MCRAKAFLNAGECGELLDSEVPLATSISALPSAAARAQSKWAKMQSKSIHVRSQFGRIGTCQGKISRNGSKSVEHQ